MTAACTALARALERHGAAAAAAAAGGGGGGAHAAKRVVTRLVADFALDQDDRVWLVRTVACETQDAAAFQEAQLEAAGAFQGPAAAAAAAAGGGQAATGAGAPARRKKKQQQRRRRQGEEENLRTRSAAALRASAAMAAGGEGGDEAGDGAGSLGSSLTGSLRGGGGGGGGGGGRRGRGPKPQRAARACPGEYCDYDARFITGEDPLLDLEARLGAPGSRGGPSAAFRARVGSPSFPAPGLDAAQRQALAGGVSVGSGVSATLAAGEGLQVSQRVLQAARDERKLVRSFLERRRAAAHAAAGGGGGGGGGAAAAAAAEDYLFGAGPAELALFEGGRRRGRGAGRARGDAAAALYAPVRVCATCHQIYSLVEGARDKAIAQRLAAGDHGSEGGGGGGGRQPRRRRRRRGGGGYAEDAAPEEDDLSAASSLTEQHGFPLVDPFGISRPAGHPLGGGGGGAEDAATLVGAGAAAAAAAGAGGASSVAAAERAIAALTKGDLAELRSFTRPPPAVEMVAGAVMTLLAGGPLTWEQTRRAVANGDRFLKAVRSYSLEDLTPARRRRLQGYLDNPLFQPATIAPISRAAAKFCAWVLGTAQAAEWRAGRGHPRTNPLTGGPLFPPIGGGGGGGGGQGGGGGGGTLTFAEKLAAKRRQQLQREQDDPRLGGDDSTYQDPWPSSQKTVGTYDTSMEGYDSSSQLTSSFGKGTKSTKARTKGSSKAAVLAQARQMEHLTAGGIEETAALPGGGKAGEKVFECKDGLTRLPYRVVGRPPAAGAPAEAVNFVVLNDFFDTMEQAEILLGPALRGGGGGGAQALVFNYPGQFGASGEAGANEELADRAAELVAHLDAEGRFPARSRPFHLLGFGNGASIALAFAARHGNRYQNSLRSLVTVNGFAAVDSQLAAIMHSSLRFFESFPPNRPDLPVSYFAKFLFSEAYLQKVPLQLALSLHTAVSNHITLAGRAQICRGALRHRDLRRELRALRVPVVAVQATEDVLVNPANADAWLEGRRALCLYDHQVQDRGPADRNALGPEGAGALLAALGRADGCFLLWLRGGHALAQERRRAVADLLRALARPTPAATGARLPAGAPAPRLAPSGDFLAQAGAGEGARPTARAAAAGERRRAREERAREEAEKVAAVYSMTADEALGLGLTTAPVGSKEGAAGAAAATLRGMEGPAPGLPPMLAGDAGGEAADRGVEESKGEHGPAAAAAAAGTQRRRRRRRRKPRAGDEEDAASAGSAEAALAEESLDMSHLTLPSGYPTPSPIRAGARAAAADEEEEEEEGAGGEAASLASTASSLGRSQVRFADHHHHRSGGSSPAYAGASRVYPAAVDDATGRVRIGGGAAGGGGGGGGGAAGMVPDMMGRELRGGVQASQAQREAGSWVEHVPTAAEVLAEVSEIEKKTRAALAELERKQLLENGGVLPEQESNDAAARLRRIELEHEQRRARLAEEEARIMEGLEVDLRRRRLEQASMQRRAEIDDLEADLVAKGAIPAFGGTRAPVRSMRPQDYRAPPDLPHHLRPPTVSSVDKLFQELEEMDRASRTAGFGRLEEFQTAKARMEQAEYEEKTRLKASLMTEEQKARQAMALRIQRVMRGGLGRKKARERRKIALASERQKAAALKLTAAGRGYLGRRRFRALQAQWLEELLLGRSARDVQRAWRGHAARQRVRAVRRERALRLLQRVYRGHRGREAARAARRRLEELRRRNLAATRLQSAWRMNRQWRRYEALRVQALAATEVQRLFRGHVARKKVRRRREWDAAAPGPDRMRLGVRQLEEAKLAFDRQQAEIDALHRSQEKAEARISHINAELKDAEGELHVLEREMTEVDHIEQELAQLTHERDLLQRGLVEGAAGVGLVAPPSAAAGMGGGGAAGAAAGGGGGGGAAAANQQREMGARRRALEIQLQMKRAERDRRRQELEAEFAAVYEEVARKKGELARLEGALADLEAARARKEREFARLQANLMQLLAEQKYELDALREKGVELELASASTAAAAQATAAKAKQAQENSNAMFSQTEELMRFQFMAQALSYFSGLNMLGQMRDMNADTTQAAVSGAAEAARAAAAVSHAAALPTVTDAGLAGAGAELAAAANARKRAALAEAQRAKRDADEAELRAFPEDLALWTVEDVGRWLTTLNLPQYVQAFRDGSVDGKFLMDLRDSDIQQMLGVSHPLHVRKITVNRERLLPLSAQEQGKMSRIKEEEKANQDRELPDKDTVFSQVRNNRIKRVEEALALGVDPNLEDERGNSLLMVAAQNLNRRMCELLLARGASVNHQNAVGNTALHFAMTYDPEGTLGEFLIMHGADDGIENGQGLTAYDGIGS